MFLVKIHPETREKIGEQLEIGECEKILDFAGHNAHDFLLSEKEVTEEKLKEYMKFVDACMVFCKNYSVSYCKAIVLACRGKCIPALENVAGLQQVEHVDAVFLTAGMLEQAKWMTRGKTVAEQISEEIEKNASLFICNDKECAQIRKEKPINWRVNELSLEELKQKEKEEREKKQKEEREKKQKEEREKKPMSVPSKANYQSIIAKRGNPIRRIVNSKTSSRRKKHER